MEQIKAADKRNVILRVLTLVVIPLPIMVLAIVVGAAGGQNKLFSPGRDGYEIEFVVETLYPEFKDTNCSLTTDYEGSTRIKLGDTVLWSGQVNPNGKFKPGSGSTESYTIYWIPMYTAGVPMERGHWGTNLSEETMIDIAGQVGPPGEVYAIVIRDTRDSWHSGHFNVSTGDDTARALTARGLNPILADDRSLDDTLAGYEDVYLIGRNGSFVARGRYEVATGLLMDMVSMTRNGEGLIRTKDNMSRTEFIDLLLPFVVLVSAVLAGYEIFVVSVKAARRKMGIPVAMDFAFYGYTAALVDVYIDFVFHPFVNSLALIGIHLLIVPLFWFRLGRWSILPFMEIIVAFITLITFDSFMPGFTYFPASLCAWLMAILSQGTISPGIIPKLEYFKKLTK
jgi:hypothetical protein